MREQVRAVTGAHADMQEDVQRANQQLANYRSRLLKLEEALKADKNVEGNFLVMLKNADEAVAERDKLLRARNKAFASAREHHDRKMAELHAVVDTLQHAVHERDLLLAAHGIPLPEPSTASLSTDGGAGDGAGGRAAAGASGRDPAASPGPTDAVSIVLAPMPKPPSLQQKTRTVQAVYGAAVPGAKKKSRKASGRRELASSVHGSDRRLTGESSLVLPDGVHASELMPIPEESSRTMAHVLAPSDTASLVSEVPSTADLKEDGVQGAVVED